MKEKAIRWNDWCRTRQGILYGPHQRGWRMTTQALRLKRTLSLKIWPHGLFFARQDIIPWSGQTSAVPSSSSPLINQINTHNVYHINLKLHASNVLYGVTYVILTASYDSSSISREIMSSLLASKLHPILPLKEYNTMIKIIVFKKKIMEIEL